MAEADSITRLILQLRAEDPAARDDAARRLWQAYFPRLLKLASARIDQGIRARADEEDVLQSMYKSFCLRQQRGDFDLANRDELWHVLVLITRRKITNLAKHHRRQRRDYRRDRAIPGTDDSRTGPGEGPPEVVDESDPTPAEAAVLEEEMERRLRMLSEDLRQIALWRLQGYSNEEIAGPGMLDCAVRTVERKLARIRKAWTFSPTGETGEGENQ
jgi:hypothetical protein